MNFKEWWDKEDPMSSPYSDYYSIADCAEMVWDYQQQKIDQLEKELYDVKFCQSLVPKSAVDESAEPKVNAVNKPMPR